MSGKVPKRVSSERTAGSREGTRIVNGIKMNEGAVLLGLVGSVGHGGSSWRTLKKKSYVSELQVDRKISQSTPAQSTPAQSTPAQSTTVTNGGFMHLHLMSQVTHRVG